jgi:hypothetical protein
MGGKNRLFGSVLWLISGCVIYQNGQGVGRILIIVLYISRVLLQS